VCDVRPFPVPSGRPLDVHCSPLGSQTLQMSWKHPETQHWNGVIQGYVVTYDSIDRGTRGDPTDVPGVKRV